MHDVRRVAWLVSALNADIASVRYRCCYPAQLLKSQGNAISVFSDADNLIKNIKSFDAVIVVKRLDPAIVSVAAACRVNHISFILDLCDDILSPVYMRHSSPRNRMVFSAVAPLTDLLVTTTHYLARLLRSYAPAHMPPTTVIPDMVEDTAMVSGAIDLLHSDASKKTGSSLPEKTAKATGKAASTIRWVMEKSAKWLSDPGKTLNTLDSMRRERRAMSTAKPASKETDKYRAPKKGRPRVLWFGNHGAPHSDFGMNSLMPAISDLEFVNTKFPFELVIVSNNKRKYKALFNKGPLRSRYVEWSHDALNAELETADIVLITIGKDSFSKAKSANRALKALHCGIPVVSQPLGSLRPLSECIQMGSIKNGLLSYLATPEQGKNDIKKAQGIIAERFSPPAIATLWETALHKARNNQSRHRKNATHDVSGVAIVVDLLQDVEIALPIAENIIKRKIRLDIITSERCLRSSPRLHQWLKSKKIIPTFISSVDMKHLDSRWFHNISHLLTISETSGGPHKIAHALTHIANGANIKTATLQHGFENIALTYRDEEYGDDISIAAQNIYIWGEPDGLPSWVSQSIRQRAIGTGRINSTGSAKREHKHPRLMGTAAKIGVFENLHWSRYPETYRAHFLTHLGATAAKAPDVTFFVKPHPAGRWLTKHPEMLTTLPDNVIIMHPNEKDWAMVGAHDIISAVDGVITTPSSIAIDAAQCAKRVAIVKDDLNDLENYDPLDFLETTEDWHTFVNQVTQGQKTQDMSKTDAFLKRVCKTTKTQDAIDFLISHFLK